VGVIRKELGDEGRGLKTNSRSSREKTYKGGNTVRNQHSSQRPEAIDATGRLKRDKQTGGRNGGDEICQKNIRGSVSLPLGGGSGKALEKSWRGESLVQVAGFIESVGRSCTPGRSMGGCGGMQRRARKKTDKTSARRRLKMESIELDRASR